MAQRLPSPPPGFDELNVEEKLTYVQSLWDRIAATPEAVPVPDWHREVIDERMNKSGTVVRRPWAKFRDELQTRIKERKP